VSPSHHTYGALRVAPAAAINLVARVIDYDGNF
jgi:hypothetical protein